MNVNTITTVDILHHHTVQYEAEQTMIAVGGWFTVPFALIES